MGTHRCNYITTKTYKKLQNDTDPWFCKCCIKSQIPFSSVNNAQLNHLNEINKPSDYTKTYNEEYLFSQTEIIPGENPNCNQYYDLDDLNTINTNKLKNSYFHLNISSLSYHFDELQDLLSDINFKFDIIGITESKIQSNTQPLTNINLPGYDIEYTTGVFPSMFKDAEIIPIHKKDDNLICSNYRPI